MKVGTLLNRIITLSHSLNSAAASGEAGALRDGGSRF